MRLLWTGAVLLLIFLSAFALRSHQVPFFIDLPLCVCWWLVVIDLPHGFAGDMLLLIFLYVFALNRCHVAINLPLCVCLWHVDIVLPISICPLQVPCCYWAPSVRLLLTGTVPTMLLWMFPYTISLQLPCFFYLHVRVCCQQVPYWFRYNVVIDHHGAMLLLISLCVFALNRCHVVFDPNLCIWWCHVVTDLPYLPLTGAILLDFLFAFILNRSHVVMNVSLCVNFQQVPCC